jgi:hypothetical protein
MWANSPDGIEAAGSVDAWYSDFQEPWPGPGSISQDPLFDTPVTGSWTTGGTFNAATYQVVLTDASANWTTNRWTGYLVNPDTTQPRQFRIAGNTTTTLSIWADYQTISAAASWVVSGSPYSIRGYRLTGESPCIDAGGNFFVPADVADLDHDADTAERVPLDLDGWARFTDFPPPGGTGAADPPYYPDIVDMGVYERFRDCNSNDIPDSIDISDETSDDCNSNSVPDECETDLGPFIIDSPVGGDVCEGMEALFVVEATGTPPISYQWRKDGIDIANATEATYLISSVTLDDADVYDVAVTDACGSRLSSPATLTVWPTGVPDMNGDGVINALDIQLFVDVHLGYETDWRRLCACDMDGDGDLDPEDIPLFVSALLLAA